MWLTSDPFGRMRSIRYARDTRSAVRSATGTVLTIATLLVGQVVRTTQHSKHHMSRINDPAPVHVAPCHFMCLLSALRAPGLAPPHGVGTHLRLNKSPTGAGFAVRQNP